MADLHIEYLPVGSLKPYPRNARTHSQKAFDVGSARSHADFRVPSMA